MNGAHLASPIRGELGCAHWPQLGSQIYCIIGNQIWDLIGKQDLCPNFALTAAKFVFSNSGNFRAKANPPKAQSPGLALNAHSGNEWGKIQVLTGMQLSPRIIRRNNRLAVTYLFTSIKVTRAVVLFKNIYM